MFTFHTGTQFCIRDLNKAPGFKGQDHAQMISRYLTTEYEGTYWSDTGDFTFPKSKETAVLEFLAKAGIS